MLLGRGRYCVFDPSESPLNKVAAWGLTLWPKGSSAFGEPGAEYGFASWVCCIVGLDVCRLCIGDDGAFDERRRRLSMSSSTMLTKRSVGSSTLARLTVNVRSCSANLSHPKNCRKSTSVISRALMFLKASNGTAVSNGNSSYPLINRALRSEDNFRQGTFVKQNIGT